MLRSFSRKALTLLAGLTVLLTLSTFLAMPVNAAVDNFNLFGSASLGWGFTAGSISSPGPKILVLMGDTVNLTLTSIDGLPHEFFVDYNGNGIADSGEPTSPPFSGTVNYQFNATTAGAFTYYCAFHPGIMFGTFEASAVPVNDVAVTNVTLEKTVVGQGFSAGINITVANNGNVGETFNVTTYRLGDTNQVTLSGSATSGWNGTIPGPAIAVNLGSTVRLTLISADSFAHKFYVDYNGNASPDPGEPTSPSFTGTITYSFMTTVNGTFTYYCAFHQSIMHGTFTVNGLLTETRIDSQAVSPPLAPGEREVLAFMWNTAGVPLGNYTIKAAADTVPNETNIVDNNFINGWIVVAGTGDLTGGSASASDFVPDGKVDIKDISIVAKHFGQGAPPAPLNCDVTGPTPGVPDGKIDIRDISTVAKHFGQQYPYP